MIERAKDIQRQIAVLQAKAEDYRLEIEVLEDELGDVESNLSDTTNKIDALLDELKRLAEKHPEVAGYLQSLEDWRRAMSNPRQIKLPVLEVRPA